MANMVEKIDEQYATKSRAEVEQFMLDAKAQLLADPDSDVADLIVVCNELGGMYRESSRYEESVENFLMAFDKTEHMMGTRVCDECAIIMINVAGTYRYMGDYDKALVHYNNAMHILLGLHKDGTYEYASLLNNMSNNFQDMGDYDKAMSYAMEGYEIIKEQCAGQGEEAVSLMNLAALASRTGDLEKAGEYGRRAKQIYESLGRTGGHYPAAVNIVAVVDFKLGNYEDALEGFKRSAELTKENLGENRDYATALMNIAAVHEKLGDMEAARECIDRANKIREGLK